jgi:hypothetical protein
MPANTGSSSYAAVQSGSGGGECYLFEVDLATCIPFADGPIGYSWRFADLGTTNVLAGTFPFLSCVQSCSSSGPDRQGMVDLLDKYSPPGTFLTTFTFDTSAFDSSGNYFTSISMEISELVDVESVATTWNSQGVNTDVLSSGAIVIGRSWETAIALAHGHGAAGPTSIRVRVSSINGPNLTSPTGHPYELLIAGPLGLSWTDVHDGATADHEPDFPVPNDPALVGLPWAAQGTVVGGGRADLTTARCGVIGSRDDVADP